MYLVKSSPCTQTVVLCSWHARSQGLLEGVPRNVQDEISTGLDSSTTFQIVRSLRDFVQQGSATAMIALLQPAPEVFVIPSAYSAFT